MFNPLQFLFFYAPRDWPLATGKPLSCFWSLSAIIPIVFDSALPSDNDVYSCRFPDVELESLLKLESLLQRTLVPFSWDTVCKSTLCCLRQPGCLLAWPCFFFKGQKEEI